MNVCNFVAWLLGYRIVELGYWILVSLVAGFLLWRRSKPLHNDVELVDCEWFVFSGELSASA